MTPDELQHLQQVVGDFKRETAERAQTGDQDALTYILAEVRDTLDLGRDVHPAYRPFIARLSELPALLRQGGRPLKAGAEHTYWQPRADAKHERDIELAIEFSRLSRARSTRYGIAAEIAERYGVVPRVVQDAVREHGGIADEIVARDEAFYASLVTDEDDAEDEAPAVPVDPHATCTTLAAIAAEASRLDRQLGLLPAHLRLRRLAEWRLRCRDDPALADCGHEDHRYTITAYRALTLLLTKYS